MRIQDFEKGAAGDADFFRADFEGSNYQSLSDCTWPLALMRMAAGGVRPSRLGYPGITQGEFVSL